MDVSSIQTFLEKVDKDFIIPLSKKTDLFNLAVKYNTFGTLCYEEQDGEIVALLAGYTENTPNNVGYISMVAALKTKRNRGICTRLVSAFLAIAKKRNLSAVHVYTHCSNCAALAMYKRNGFTEANDTSDDDLVHLICVL